MEFKAKKLTSLFPLEKNPLVINSHRKKAELAIKFSKEFIFHLIY